MTPQPGFCEQRNSSTGTGTGTGLKFIYPHTRIFSYASGGRRNKTERAFASSESTTETFLGPASMEGHQGTLEPDLDIDDPYDRVTIMPLNLPQELVSTIGQMTQVSLSATEELDAHHFKSRKLQNADRSKIKVILKYPFLSKFLLLDTTTKRFFLLQGGRNDQLKAEATAASELARKCLIVFTMHKRKHACIAENAILLPEPIAWVERREIPTVKDVIEKYAYAERRTNFLTHLPACWSAEGVEFQDLYPSFRSWKSFPEDFSRSITFQQFNVMILGRDSSYLLPSEVTAKQAWQCLQMQANHNWKIKLEDSEIQKQKVALRSMSVDFDYGLVYLKNALRSNLSNQNIVLAVEKLLPQAQHMSGTAYVPRGKNWRFATDTHFLPTIYDKKSSYVLLPTPEHTAEVYKMWIFVEQQYLPDNFIDKIRNAFQTAARMIVELDHHSIQSTKALSISVLDFNSTSQATIVRGGVLLSLVSFFILSREVPNVELVMETYNGKQKGMSVNVAIHAETPDLNLAASSLTHKVVEANSMLFLVSSMCKEGLVDVDALRSSLGFGYRMCYNERESDKVAYSILKCSDTGRGEIRYPMGFIPPSICPNLAFGPFELGAQADDAIKIQRAQSYLEFFSMQKASCHNQAHSHQKIGSNLSKATKSDGSQDILNLSALKHSLSEIVHRIDQSFHNFHAIGGSRIEIAIQPFLSKDQNSLVFDFEECIHKCWEFLIAKTVFYRNEDIAQYGAINAAACALGYRFSLDALSVSNNTTLQDNQAQQHAFCFMRYLNAVLNTICNGRYVDENPKLFMSKLGSTVGRPLNLIPDIPRNISEHICEYVQDELPEIEAPKPPEPTLRENLIQARIDSNRSMEQMQSVITVCYSCGKCFYGKWSIFLRHYHPCNHDCHRFPRDSDRITTQAFGKIHCA
jgi:hypothetical protein